MANLHPEISKWFAMAAPEADPSVDPLGAAQMLKATMIERWPNREGVDEAWHSIIATLKRPDSLVRFFIDLPERPSADPYGHAFGRRVPAGADVAPLDIDAATARLKRYRDAAEEVYKLIDKEFGGMLVTAQINEDAQEHVIPVSVALPSMREGLPHLIALLSKIDPRDTIPSKQLNSKDIARKNYRAQVVDVCIRHFDKTPYSAVATIANAIAGARDDGEEWVDATALAKQINRKVDKLADK